MGGGARTDTDRHGQARVGAPRARRAGDLAKRLAPTPAEHLLPRQHLLPAPTPGSTCSATGSRRAWFRLDPVLYQSEQRIFSRAAPRWLLGRALALEAYRLAPIRPGFSLR